MLTPTKIAYLIVIYQVLQQNRRDRQVVRNKPSEDVANDAIRLLLNPEQEEGGARVTEAYSEMSFQLMFFLADQLVLDTVDAFDGNDDDQQSPDASHSGGGEHGSLVSFLASLAQYVDVQVTAYDGTSVAEAAQSKGERILRHLLDAAAGPALDLDGFLDLLEALLAQDLFSTATTAAAGGEAAGGASGLPSTSLRGPVVCGKSSALGLVVRRCWLQWRAMPFEGVCALFDDWSAFVKVHGHGQWHGQGQGLPLAEADGDVELQRVWSSWWLKQPMTAPAPVVDSAAGFVHAAEVGLGEVGAGEDNWWGDGRLLGTREDVLRARMDTDVLPHSNSVATPALPWVDPHGHRSLCGAGGGPSWAALCPTPHLRAQQATDNALLDGLLDVMLQQSGGTGAGSGAAGAGGSGGSGGGRTSRSSGGVNGRVRKNIVYSHVEANSGVLNGKGALLALAVRNIRGRAGNEDDSDLDSQDGGDGVGVRGFADADSDSDSEQQSDQEEYAMQQRGDDQREDGVVVQSKDTSRGPQMGIGARHLEALVSLDEALKAAHNVSREGDQVLITQVLLLLHHVIVAQTVQRRSGSSSMASRGNRGGVSGDAGGDDPSVSTGSAAHSSSHFHAMLRLVDAEGVLLRCLHRCRVLGLTRLAHQAALLLVRYGVQQASAASLSAALATTSTHVNPHFYWRARPVGSAAAAQCTSSNSTRSPTRLPVLQRLRISTGGESPIPASMEPDQQHKAGMSSGEAAALSLHELTRSQYYNSSHYHYHQQKVPGVSPPSTAPFPFAYHWTVLSAVMFRSLPVLDDVLNLHGRVQQQSLQIAQVQAQKGHLGSSAAGRLQPQVGSSTAAANPFVTHDALDTVIQPVGAAGAGAAAQRQQQQQQQQGGAQPTRAPGDKEGSLLADAGWDAMSDPLGVRHVHGLVQAHLIACQLWASTASVSSPTGPGPGVAMVCMQGRRVLRLVQACVRRYSLFHSDHSGPHKAQVEGRDRGHVDDLCVRSVFCGDVLLLLAHLLDAHWKLQHCRPNTEVSVRAAASAASGAGIIACTMQWLSMPQLFAAGGAATFHASAASVSAPRDMLRCLIQYLAAAAGVSSGSDDRSSTVPADDVDPHQALSAVFLQIPKQLTHLLRKSRLQGNASAEGAARSGSQSRQLPMLDRAGRCRIVVQFRLARLHELLLLVLTSPLSAGVGGLGELCVPWGAMCDLPLSPFKGVSDCDTLRVPVSVALRVARDAVLSLLHTIEDGGRRASFVYEADGGLGGTGAGTVASLHALYDLLVVRLRQQ